LKTFALTGFLSASSLRFLLRASLSVNGLSEYSGLTADTNAIHLPSGDQMALPASEEIVVSCRASPPFTSMTQSWFSPERFDSNKIRLPSGLQRGWLSFLVVFVSGRGLPSWVVANQIDEELLLPGKSTVAMT